MNKYKKALENILENAYECIPTQGKKGYYLKSNITDPKAISVIRKVVADLQRKGRM